MLQNLKTVIEHNDWLTRVAESTQTECSLCTLQSCYRVISLTHYMSGWPGTHSSMCTESILQSRIRMPPHSRHSQIFKRAFAHLMMHDSFSVLFMPTNCVWVAVQTGWICVCVSERRWSGIGGQGRVSVWNCYWQADGGGWGSGWGWGCKRLRLIKSGATDAAGKPHGE